jgi:diacylglycerol kinase (ATP)
MLVNPTLSPRRQRAVPGVRAVLEGAGYQVEVAETSPHRGGSTDLARKVSGSGFDGIVVCGGDGTVFDVLQVVAGTQIPLGVLPFGTGNVLVQNLGLPRNPIAAARMLLTAEPVAIPLGKVTCGAYAALPGRPVTSRSWYFAMSAGVGGHAAMMGASQHYYKQRTGRLSYFAAGLEILATQPIQPFELSMTPPGGESCTRLTSEMIALRVARLNLWRTGAAFDEDFLRIVSVRGASRMQLARGSFESLILASGTRQQAGGAASYNDVSAATVRLVEGRHYTGPVQLQADGEIIAMLTHDAPARFEMAGVSVNFMSAAHHSAAKQVVPGQQ